MSDRIRTAPDVKWRENGIGAHLMFLCARCHKRSPSFGSKKQMVRGARLLVCAGCAVVTKKAAP